MTPKKAFPIALLSDELGRSVGKRGNISACHQGNPSWEVGESPSHILLNHAFTFTLYVATFLSSQGWSHQTRRVLFTF